MDGLSHAEMTSLPSGPTHGRPPSGSAIRSSRPPTRVPSRRSATSSTDQWTLEATSTVHSDRLKGSNRLLYPIHVRRLRTRGEAKSRSTSTLSPEDRRVIKVAQALLEIKLLTIDAFPDKLKKQEWTNVAYGQAYIAEVPRMSLNQFPSDQLSAPSAEDDEQQPVMSGAMYESVSKFPCHDRNYYLPTIYSKYTNHLNFGQITSTFSCVRNDLKKICDDLVPSLYGLCVIGTDDIDQQKMHIRQSVQNLLHRGNYTKVSTCPAVL